MEHTTGSMIMHDVHKLKLTVHYLERAYSWSAHLQPVHVAELKPEMFETHKESQTQNCQRHDTHATSQLIM